MSAPKLSAEVIRFRSKIDGTEQQAAICAPASLPQDEQLPLLVELEPGSILDLEATLEDGKHYLRSLNQPAIWLRPGGRGPGTVFQGYGEVDVLEAIEAVTTRYPIDPDRISLFGFSMGGAGVWYMASHYPDRFAAAAPLGAYNDYRLWARPDGMTFPLPRWEVPSWQARSAAFLLENLRHVAIWMVHGAWDRAVGGGVDVAHARQSAHELDRLAIPYRYTELRDVGHDSSFMHEPLFTDVLRWLIEQQRPQAPEQVSFRTNGLRHNSAYWVAIQQQLRYGAFASVEANASDAINLRTHNVRHLSLQPPPKLRTATSLRIDETIIKNVDCNNEVGLRRQPDGTWTLSTARPPDGEKRPGQAGPFGDLFHTGTTLVTGTAGHSDETFFADWCARDAAFFFKQWNGGVHRGGIPGENWVDLPIVTDKEWQKSDTPTTNAIAYGASTSNSLLARIADQLPIRIDRDAIRVGDRTFKGDGIAVIATVPFPDASQRYLGLHGGTSPDAMTAGAHLNWQLLPDYLVYNPEHVLDWGFFDNEWQPISVEGTSSEQPEHERAA